MIFRDFLKQKANFDFILFSNVKYIRRVLDSANFFDNMYYAMSHEK